MSLAHPEGDTNPEFQMTSSNFSSCVDPSEKDTDWFVEVDRKISAVEWFMVITGPIVNPVYSGFIVAYAIQLYRAKKKGDRKLALKNKAMMVGLGQWAYRTTITFLCFGALIFTMVKLKRFG